jgi:acyl transferase domain-containing protein/thioesterase domain-containing protein/acyl carrier protein
MTMDDTRFETDIAVVGMAGRFAGANTLEQYWRNLRDGVESLTRFTDEELLAAGVAPSLLADPNYVRAGAVLPEMEQFDAKFFGFSPREASIMDPQHRHFLEVSWQALENSGHVPANFEGSIGIFGGSGHNAYLPYNLLTNPKLMQQLGFFLVRHTGNDKDFLTTRVSYLLNLKGPSVNVQTACSTSLVAIHLGVQSLLNRECDMALAGGVTIELPHRQGYLYRESEILSPDGHCHAFDADSRGTVFGSGVGVVVLRRLADALRDGDHIHAVIKGSAVNNDGALKVGYMAPSVEGQAQAIAEALALADVAPDTITYVEAHGTGTPVGDPIEVAALTQAYRQGTDRVGYCGIGSVKSNIGHTDTAAGVASFIKVALAMQHGELPPTLHFSKPNPACDFERSPFYVNATRKAWLPPLGIPRRAGVSSLGVGGTNAHIVLEQAPQRAPSSASRPFQLLVQSAKTLSALDAGGRALADHLRAQPELSLADVAHTLQVGRQAMGQRRAIVARDAADAAQALDSRDPQRVFTDSVAGGAARSVAFMFAGGGAQYPNMGLDLYRDEPVYRSAVDECLQILERDQGLALRDVMFPAPGAQAQAARELERPSLALPALLTTQYAQARLWMSWGIEPAAMIGHSMGEYTAAHLAGVFSLSDALALVALRGRLFETLAEGAMLSVPISEGELRALMGPDLSIAVINGPRMTVAAGPVQAIEALQQRLARQEIEAARVRINVAAHSSMLEPILAEFGAFLRRVPMQAPKLPFVSNLSGTWIDADDATDPAYWVRHLRQTVRFAQGLEALLADPSRVLLEVGPGRTLSSLARQHPSRQPVHAVFNGMRHPDEVASDQAFMLGALGRLWTVGVEIDWARLRGGEQRLRVPLPGYCFDHQRHWVEPGLSGAAVAAEQGSLHKRQDITQWFYQPVWQRTPAPRPLARDDAPGRRTLVMADALGFGERLAMRLTAAGDEVVVVRAGRWYRREAPARYTINPRSAADLDRLLSALIGGGFVPDRIVHLWTLTGAPSSSSPALDELQHLGFYALLSLAQAIGREDLSEPIRLMVVTNRLQRVTTESGLEPAKATLLGPCNVIPREFPNVSSLCADIDVPAPGSRAEQMLLDGLLGDLDGSGDGAVAWRGGERWVQSHEAMPLPAGRSRLREHGTYLITGGLGGVGLALAEHLATAVKARLILLGRHALPERAEWSRHLARPDTDPALARRLRHVMALESLGAEVLVLAADITQPASLKAALQQARARFGTLHGVLHAAGVLDDGAIQLKQPAAAAAVLAPKVQGTLALEAAIEQVHGKAPLDFLLLFSSISAFAGLAGQIDYASANAFLDAYAQSRMHRDGTPTVAVNWSQWQEVGMAAELARHLGLQADTLRDTDGIEIGHPLVRRCLLDTPAERVYAARLSAASHWLLDEHRVRGGEALIPGTGYLEIVRTAFALEAAGTEGAAVELRNVVFLAPFVVRSGEERDLRIHIRAQGAAGHAFSIVGREAGAAHADDAWVEHVHGAVGWVDEDVDPARERESASDIAARCRRHTQIGPSAQAHLQFGERWGSVNRIDFGEREALATIELPPRFAEDLKAFPLHPALMDMATGGAQSLIPGFEAARDFFVPAFYGRVRVHAPLTAMLTSHVRWRADESGGEDLASFDVTVRDAQGRVAVEINDFTMIRVRDKSLLARVATAVGAEAVPHKPRALANHVLLGQHEGILSAEGAEVVERVLSSGAGPQVVVSPQDLKVLMAQWRAPAVAVQAEAHEVEDAAQAGFVAPVTATEKMIAQLWSEMLGHARVGADDDFFDLGGHSLLAVQLINKLKKKTGRALPLTALLEAPTVRTLAALIEPPASAGAGAAAPQPSEAAALPLAAPTAVPRSATLVTIRSGSADQRPVFFIHDGLGETLLYRNLALKLQPGHAVYGIQPEVDAHGVFAQSSIRGWASAHIRVMRSVQPQGPYLLAGLCAGGVVAFEMARQLEDAGEHTQYVGILDAADTQAEERALRVAHERWGRLRRVFEDDGSGLPAWRRAGRGVHLLGAKAFNLARYEWSSRLKRWANERKASRLGVQASTGQAPSAESALPFLHLYEFAHRRHLPQGVFSAGRVVLYRAMKGDGTPGDEPYVDQYADPLFGWAPRVAGTVALVDVPGGHASLLQEPNVGVLARHMRADIERALADVTTATPALPLPAAAAGAAAPVPNREAPATAEA